MSNCVWIAVSVVIIFFFELMFPHLHIGPCLLTLAENFYPHSTECLQSYTCAQMLMQTVHMYHNKQKTSEPQERNCFSLRESCINFFFFLFLPVNVMKTLARYSITH